jgi:hypothetical protein
MKRWIVTAVLAAATMATGCASLKFVNPFAAKKPAKTDVLPPAEWAALKAENARRLAGEGLPAKPGTTPPPAPITGNFEQFTGFLKSVFYEFPKRSLDLYTGKTPGRYARMMEDEQSADLRRTGILRLAADYPFARAEPYTDRYWQIAQGDPNTMVRVAAIRALDRARDRRVVPLAINYMNEADPLLRLEAAKALANMPDDKATPALLRHMGPTIEVRGESGRPEPQSESRDVRVACADALRNFQTKDIARALIDVLQDKQFEVSYQAHKSLILMTGHDYGYDIGKWRDFLSTAENPFGA